MKLLKSPAVLAVLVAMFVLEAGVFAILPILPLYLRERGIDYSVAGLIVGANLAAQVVFQYPAGRLSDRIGRRSLMVAGLVLAGLAAAALVLPAPAAVLIVIRFVQGIGGAAFVPAATAALADAVPSEKRGEAFGLLNAAIIGGLTVGPGVGGLLAGFGRAPVFELTGLLLLVDAVLVLVLLPQREVAATTPTVMAARIPRSPLTAVALIWIGGGFLFGLYDLVWSLFMRSFGATDLMIGASFSLFGLPFLVMSPVAGRLADRFDRRFLAVGGLAVAGLLAPVYPLLHSFWPVVIVGVLEAVGVSLCDPAALAYLMDFTPETHRGRVQGGMGALEFAAQASGAVSAGPLFAAAVPLPFFAGSAVCLGAVLLSVPFFRAAGTRRSAAEPAPVT